MYVSPRDAQKYLGVSRSKLQCLRSAGLIEYYTTDGGQHRYNTLSLDHYKDGIVREEKKTNYIYARVSSIHQKGDLERQVNFLCELYPKHKVIRDIGSGLNFKRRGFRSLLEQIRKGSVGEVVVAYKDRLCRFGYELVEWLINVNGGRIIVQNKEGHAKTAESELTEDLVAIISVFSARIHGSRSYNRKRKTIQNEKDKDQTNWNTVKMDDKDHGCNSGVA